MFKVLAGSLLCAVLAVSAAGAAPGDAPPAEAGQTKLSPACADAIEATRADGTQAYEAHDWAKAEAIADKATPPCANDVLARSMLDTLRALAVYHQGDPNRALAIVQTPGVSPNSPNWLMSRFIEVASFRSLGRTADAIRVRDELVAATEARLTGGAEPYMTRVERFETPYALVDAYQEIPRGRGLREVFFLASPKDGAMPVSLSGSFKMKGAVQEAPLGDMDMTWCTGNALLAMIDKVRTYADLRDYARQELSVPPPAESVVQDLPTAAVKPAAPTGPEEVCQQARFIFRGLTPD